MKNEIKFTDPVFSFEDVGKLRVFADVQREYLMIQLNKPENDAASKGTFRLGVEILTGIMNEITDLINNKAKELNIN